VISGPLLFPPVADGVNMRKADGASIPARKASLPAGGGHNGATQLVCLALALALLALALRIASIW
jgi:hypothetical protein